MGRTKTKKTQASSKNKELGFKEEKNADNFPYLRSCLFHANLFSSPRCLPSPSKKDLDSFFPYELSVYPLENYTEKTTLLYLTSFLSFTLFMCYF